MGFTSLKLHLKCFNSATFGRPQKNAVGRAKEDRGFRPDGSSVQEGPGKETGSLQMGCIGHGGPVPGLSPPWGPEHHRLLFMFCMYWYTSNSSIHLDRKAEGK